MTVLTHFFWTLLAALFLLEAWLWTYVGGAIHWVVARLPIEPLRRALRWLVAHIPPWAVLIVFVVPVLALLPLKILAVALIAKKKIFSAGLVYFVAKTVGVGLTAFLFDACRDKLLEMGWFSRLYGLTLRALAWAHAKVDPYKTRIRTLAATIKHAALERMRGNGRFGRKVTLLRERVKRSVS